MGSSHRQSRDPINGPGVDIAYRGTYHSDTFRPPSMHVSVLCRICSPSTCLDRGPAFIFRGLAGLSRIENCFPLGLHFALSLELKSHESHVIRAPKRDLTS